MYLDVSVFVHNAGLAEQSMYDCPPRVEKVEQWVRILQQKASKRSGPSNVPAQGKLVMGTSLGIRGNNFVPSSNIGSVWSGRLELRTSDAKSDFAALAHSSRMRLGLQLANAPWLIAGECALVHF